MASSPWIFDVTEADFETKVLEASHKTPVVVDFWATWCEPCKILGPVLEKGITDRKGEILLAKIDADQQQKLAMYWNIEGLPTVLAFKGGKPVDEFVGNLPEAAIHQFLDRLLPTRRPTARRMPERLLEQTDPAKAEQSYRDALAKNPNQESATLGLARLLIQQDRDAEAADLLEQLGPGSDQGVEVERVNALLWLRKTAHDLEPEPVHSRERLAGNAKDAVALYQLGVRKAVEGKGSEALEMLYSAGEKDAKLAATRVREAMVKVFQIVGNRRSACRRLSVPPDITPVLRRNFRFSRAKFFCGDRVQVGR